MAQGADRQAANDQDGLIVWLWRIVQFSEIPGLVSEADFHLGLKDGYGHRMVAIGSAARDRVGNSVCLGVLWTAFFNKSKRRTLSWLPSHQAGTRKCRYLKSQRQCEVAGDEPGSAG